MSMRREEEEAQKDKKDNTFVQSAFVDIQMRQSRCTISRPSIQRIH